MFLTNEQADKRLSSENNLANRFSKNSNSVRANAKIPEKQVTEILNPEVIVTEKVITLPGKNRVNLSEEERNEIAIETRSGIISQTESAKQRGLNVLTVHNIAQGKTKGIDEEKVNQVINTVRDRALDRLMHSLGLLTDDKLSGCSAKDLSLIASNMGRVVEKIQDKTEKPDNINFIIYAPELKQERSFDVVEI
jgi:hypothetical protein